MRLRDIFKDQRPVYGQDPYVLMVNDTPYLCESIDEEKISISQLNSLTDLQRVDSTIIWDDPKEHQVWAPEVHHIDGFWYVYYTASDGNNSKHRPYLLRAYEFLGPYKPVEMIGPDIWGIDMTTFWWMGKRYAVWSGWENNGDEFPQNLYIAEMLHPWHIENRIRLSVPELAWELSCSPVLEGPQIWINDRGVNILYSANASWKQEYSTGLLTLVDRNPLDPKDWEKRSLPLMQNAGHGCVVGDYFIYHRKLSTFPGWTDREIRSIPLKELSSEN